MAENCGCGPTRLRKIKERAREIPRRARGPKRRSRVWSTCLGGSGGARWGPAFSSRTRLRDEAIAKKRFHWEKRPHGHAAAVHQDNSHVRARTGAPLLPAEGSTSRAASEIGRSRELRATLRPYQRKRLNDGRTIRGSDISRGTSLSLPARVQRIFCQSGRFRDDWEIAWNEVEGFDCCVIENNPIRF